MVVYIVSHRIFIEKEHRRIILDNGNVSPDGTWKIVIEKNQIRWIKLTKNEEKYTIKEIVEATKNIDPSIWKK